jgi:exonuclease III
MKLITLNVWGGKLYEPLMKFLQEQSADTDIFCFQDVLFGTTPGFSPVQHGRLNLCKEIENILPDFRYFVNRDPRDSYIHGEVLALDVGCGQAIFIRSSINVLENGGFFSHPESSYQKGGDMLSGKCQWIKIESENGEVVTVLNLHGLWKRNSQKKDIPERLEQSQKIQEFFKEHDGKKILCGDFNIINDGNAMAILEENMINLVKKYAITSTRNSYYSKEEKFADYALISEDVRVTDFKVLPEEVSDHLALMLEFN